MVSTTIRICICINYKTTLIKRQVIHYNTLYHLATTHRCQPKACSATKESAVFRKKKNWTELETVVYLLTISSYQNMLLTSWLYHYRYCHHHHHYQHCHHRDDVIVPKKKKKEKFFFKKIKFLYWVWSARLYVCMYVHIFKVKAY